MFLNVYFRYRSTPFIRRPICLKTDTEFKKKISMNEKCQIQEVNKSSPADFNIQKIKNKIKKSTRRN